MNFEECITQINYIYGDSFPGIDLGTVMYWECKRVSSGNIEYHTKEFMLSLIKQVFNLRNHYVLSSHEGSTLLFFNHTSRLQHIKSFNSICELASNKDVVQIQVTKHKFAPIRLVPCRIRQLIKWLSRSIKLHISFRDFLYFTVIAQLSLEAMRQISMWDLAQYKAIITYYDLIWDSSILVQLAKKDNIPVITLQHGIFSGKVFPEDYYGNDTDDIEIETAADVFLAWNQLTKQHMIGRGIDSEHICILGAPRNFDGARPQMSRQKLRAFGVVFSCSKYEDSILVHIANEISRITKMKYYVRYHPLQSGHEYDEICNMEYCLGSTSHRDIKLYADSVSFSIVGRSTMFVDLLSIGARAYHYVDKRGYGAYKVSECSFSDALDVIRYENNLDDTSSQWQYCLNYLLGPENAADLYRAFFRYLQSDEFSGMDSFDSARWAN